jgi:hypothetical protein
MEPTTTKTPITDEQFDQVLKIITTTPMSLHKACKQIGIANSSFYDYMIIKGDKAKCRYARAKDDQCDLVADDCQDIADNCEDSNKARLQVDTRKWYLSKIKPKRYGDHQQIEIVSSVNKFIESTIKIISEYLPVDKRAEAIGRIQASIDFND